MAIKLLLVMASMILCAMATPTVTTPGGASSNGGAKVSWKPDLGILTTDPQRWSQDMKSAAMVALGAAALSYYLGFKLMQILFLAGLAYGLHGLETTQYLVAAVMLWSAKTKNKLGILGSGWFLYCWYKGWHPIPSL